MTPLNSFRDGGKGAMDADQETITNDNLLGRSVTEASSKFLSSVWPPLPTMFKIPFVHNYNNSNNNNGYLNNNNKGLFNFSLSGIGNSDESFTTSSTTRDSFSVTALGVNPALVQSTFHCRNIGGDSRRKNRKNTNGANGGDDGDDDDDDSLLSASKIRDELQSVTGVERIRFNLPTKQVFVDHVPSLISAHDIIRRLMAVTGAGLGEVAHIESDGATQHLATVCSVFQCRGKTSIATAARRRQGAFTSSRVGGRGETAALADFGLGCRPCGVGGRDRRPSNTLGEEEEATDAVAHDLTAAITLSCEILKSLDGVNDISYDTLSRQIVVDHVPSKITSQTIFQELFENGIDAILLWSDQREQANGPQQQQRPSPSIFPVGGMECRPVGTTTIAQPQLLLSTFSCTRLCTDADCMLVSTILDPLEGVDYVRCDISTTQQVVTVHHHSQQISAPEILELLNDFNLGASFGTSRTLSRSLPNRNSETGASTSSLLSPSPSLLECDVAAAADAAVAANAITTTALAKYSTTAPAVMTTPTSSCHDTDDDDDMSSMSSLISPPAATSSSPSTILPKNRVAVVVRSTFHCEHLRCKAECALIDELMLRRLDPLYRMGIQHVLYLVPLKKVMVEHVPSIISASKIVQLLNNDEGNGYSFAASIEIDGGAVAVNTPASSSSTLATSTTRTPTTMLNTSIADSTKDDNDKNNYKNYRIDNNVAQRATTPCRSVLRVDHICCAAEIPAIRSILKSLPGIFRFFAVVTTKLVYVEHDPDMITATDVCDALNRERFGATVQQDGGAHHHKHSFWSSSAAAAAPGSTATAVAAPVKTTTSLFCVSTFALESRVIFQEELENALNTSFDKTEVESFYVDSKTRTLFVCHNPCTLSAERIQEILCTWPRTMVRLLVDGKDSVNIDYEAIAGTPIVKDQFTKSNEQSNNCPRPTIVLSGVLWIISMLSLFGGEWEYLKYIGLGSVTFGLPPIAAKSFHQLKRLRFDTNTLMLSASLGALALGDFTEAAAVVFLFAFSEWLEMRATSRVLQALSAIVNLKPEKANLVHHETHELIEVAASAVPTGALVAVKTGEKVPCDGIVAEGHSTVDESSLTGESRPIRKRPKDSVSGGTVNSGMSQLLVRTTALAENSAVARLVRLVEEAQANRSETEKMVDAFASIYTPLVVASAALMCTIPWAFGLETGRHWTEIGLVFIVVACPCALIISTPMAYVAGLAATAQRGVLVKGGAFLESLGKVKNICFDKTGTLTNGEFALLHLEVLTHKYSREEIIQHIALMEERASHPVANAILERVRNEKVVIPPSMVLKKHKLLAGEGVTGIIDGKQVHVGNERLFERLGMLACIPQETRFIVDSWKQLGGTIGFMSIEGAGIVCAYCAADGVREESHRVVSNLKKRGINITMLTGDNEEAALSVGRQIGLEPHEIRSRLLPEEKLEFLKNVKLQENDESSFSLWSRKNRNVVLFCGDGVNDAPALAAADVGVAMGAGAALAMETADVTLLDSNLEKLETSVQVGRLVIRIIWENVIFCVVTKFIVLGFAMAGKTHLWAAIATDVGSMILVTLNAMTLLGTRNSSPYGEDFDLDVVKRETSKVPIGQTCRNSEDGSSLNTYQQVPLEDVPSQDTLV